MASNLGEKSVTPAPERKMWKRAALSKTNETSVDNDDDVDNKHQLLYGTKCQAACAIFSEYCDYSTIHGVKYLGEKKRPLLEKLFWVLFLGLSIHFSVIFIAEIWDQWTNNPVIVSFAKKSTSVSQIPFPTVTVCPVTKTRPALFNFTDVYWRARDIQKNISIDALSNEELNNLLSVAQVCDSHLATLLKYNATEIDGLRLIKTLSQLMPEYNNTIRICNFSGTKNACDQQVKKYFNEEGVCYSFNALSPYEIYHKEGIMPELLLDAENRTAVGWNLEDGYNVTSNRTFYPNRSLNAGSKGGLLMIMRGAPTHYDYLCSGPVQGFKVFLSTPGEIPQAKKQFFRIPFGKSTVIGIKPKVITTSKELKKYTPHQRQCYFQNEYRLRYFNFYTQSNCELECLANFTLASCGCVKFSMPRNKDVPICGVSKIKCAKKAEDELVFQNFILNGKASHDNKNENDKKQCDCLPACNSISYDAELSQSSIAFKVSKDESYSKLVSLSVYYKEAQYLSYNRAELYGTTDFLANCGGLLGLFMGISTFSIIEIIYFCTVRLIMNFRLRYKKNSTQKPVEKSFASNYIPDDNAAKYTSTITNL